METVCLGEGDNCDCSNLLGNEGLCVLDAKNNTVIAIFLWIEVLMGAVLHLIGFIWALSIFIRHHVRGRPLKEIATLNLHKSTLLLAMSAELMRIIYFALDPHSATGILGRAADPLYAFPSTLWAATFDAVILGYLSAVSRVSNLQYSTSSFQGVRILLFIVIGWCAFVMIPIIIYSSVTNDDVGWLLYDVGVFFAAITCLIVSIVYIIKIYRLLNESEHRTASFAAYLRRSTYILGGISLNFTLLIIFIFISIFITKQPWNLLALQILFRLFEAGALYFGLLFLGNRISTGSAKPSDRSATLDTKAEKSSNSIANNKTSAKVDSTNNGNIAEKHSQTAVTTIETHASGDDDRDRRVVDRTPTNESIGSNTPLVNNNNDDNNNVVVKN